MNPVTTAGPLHPATAIARARFSLRAFARLWSAALETSRRGQSSVRSVLRCSLQPRRPRRPLSRGDLADHGDLQHGPRSIVHRSQRCSRRSSYTDRRNSVRNSPRSRQRGCVRSSLRNSVLKLMGLTAATTTTQPGKRGCARLWHSMPTTRCGLARVAGIATRARACSTFALPVQIAQIGLACRYQWADRFGVILVKHGFYLGCRPVRSYPLVLGLRLPLQAMTIRIPTCLVWVPGQIVPTRTRTAS